MLGQPICANERDDCKGPNALSGRNSPSQKPANIVSSVKGRTERLNSKSPQILCRTLRYCWASAPLVGATSKNERCLAACCSSFLPMGCGFRRYPVKYWVAFLAACCIRRCSRCRAPCRRQFRSQAGLCVSGSNGRKLTPVWLFPSNMSEKACNDNHGVSRGFNAQPKPFDRRPYFVGTGERCRGRSLGRCHTELWGIHACICWVRFFATPG